MALVGEPVHQLERAEPQHHDQRSDFSKKSDDCRLVSHQKQLSDPLP